ncbi:MAG: hypothetical protein ABH828_02850 [archaeon]
MGLYEEIMSRVISIVFIAAIIYLFYLVMKKRAEKFAETTADVHVCPKCGGLKLERVNNPGDIVMGEVSSRYTFKCHECGYNGLAPMIDRKNLESFKKELNKTKKKK